MSKIDLHDSMMDIVTKMSEGNPGAMAFVMDYNMLAYCIDLCVS